MAKITIESIQNELAASGWKIHSLEYKNLDAQLEFECPNGHRVYSSWKKVRAKQECPVCKQKQFQQVEKVVSKPKGATRILALDQATKVTGYSIFDNGQLIKYGTFSVSIEDEIARCVAIKNWLISMIENWHPDFIGVEGIQYQPKTFDGDSVGSVTLFQTLAHLQGVLLVTCHELNIPYRVCPTNTWRNVVGVKGRARADRKKSMQLIVKENYWVDVTDDEADAIGIGRYMVSIVNKNTEVANWET